MNYLEIRWNSLGSGFRLEKFRRLPRFLLSILAHRLAGQGFKILCQKSHCRIMCNMGYCWTEWWWPIRKHIRLSDRKLKENQVLYNLHDIQRYVKAFLTISTNLGRERDKIKRPSSSGDRQQGALHWTLSFSPRHVLLLKKWSCSLEREWTYRDARKHQPIHEIQFNGVNASFF